VRNHGPVEQQRRRVQGQCNDHGRLLARRRHDGPAGHVGEDALEAAYRVRDCLPGEQGLSRTNPMAALRTILPGSQRIGVGEGESDHELVTVRRSRTVDLGPGFPGKALAASTIPCTHASSSASRPGTGRRATTTVTGNPALLPAWSFCALTTAPPRTVPALLSPFSCAGHQRGGAVPWRGTPTKWPRSLV
jgi:hypothetical protein